MYLSKLELNPRSCAARRDLASPYELHRTLARAFTTPEGADYRATHGVLFRLESPAGAGARPVVLVQSATAPNWQQLDADYLSQPAQCKVFTPVFSAGQVLGFRLSANPTKKAARQGRRQGNRVPLWDRAEGEGPTSAQQWLHRKAELGGFNVLHVFSESFSLTGSGVAASPHKKSSLVHYGVRFEGLLRVINPDLFAAALLQGVGPAKAFGFGLLSLVQAAAPGQVCLAE